MSQALLDQVLERLNSMPALEQKKIIKQVTEIRHKLSFIPHVGPQTQAYHSKADILLFGGNPGGGKTGLLIGLSLNAHHRSLLVRKQFTDVEAVVENAKELLGTTNGFVGGTRPKYNKPDGGIIHFQGMAAEDGFDPGKQGNPHDFIGIDEGAQLPLETILMLLGWNRTNKKGQRCRMVIATNPPLDSVGDWMVEFFAPWLDPNYHNPAEQGELRYFVLDKSNKSVEVDGLDPIEIDGTTYYPHSRTYIHSEVSDNPSINKEDYLRKLHATPEPYRSILLSGNFAYMRKDSDFQLIPTDWVIQAQQRWTERPPENTAMTVMALDPAGGGQDSAELAIRYGHWYAKLISAQGEETADGSATAATIVKHRRDACPVIVDKGGGYGGAVMLRLKDNSIEVMSFDGASSSTAKSKDGTPFANKRSEAWWRFMEALDPSQEGGAVIALPPDPELKADLTAPTWQITARGIQVEPKVRVGEGGKVVGGIRKRLGRSPGKGDAVVMAYSQGNAAVMRAKQRTVRPTIVLGYQSRKRRIH